ncbi:MAG: alpha/beta hydrolase [Planctomycetaceae bacterium]|nr:alpha/beta hydrolase [Planctomycetaceae bacterium]
MWSSRKISWLLLNLFLLFLVANLLFLLGLMYFENSMVFPAPRFPHGDWDASWLDHEDVTFFSEDGTQLHGWLVEHPEPRGFVLFCHGNGEHVAYLAEELAALRDRLQVTVFAFDYRGYGRSHGKPNESGVLADGRAAQAWLADRVRLDPDQMIVAGRSLGGAVAVDLAVQQGAHGLVLDRTFSSLPDVAARQFPWLPVRWLMRNRLASIDKIGGYQGPLLQFHGTADEIVPFELGRALFDASNSAQKQFIIVNGGGHNDPHTAEFWSELGAFIQSLGLPFKP